MLSEILMGVPRQKKVILPGKIKLQEEMKSIRKVAMGININEYQLFKITIIMPHAVYKINIQ